MIKNFIFRRALWPRSCLAVPFFLWRSSLPWSCLMQMTYCYVTKKSLFVSLVRCRFCIWKSDFSSLKSPKAHYKLLPMFTGHLGKHAFRHSCTCPPFWLGVCSGWDWCVDGSWSYHLYEPTRLLSLCHVCSTGGEWATHTFVFTWTFVTPLKGNPSPGHCLEWAAVISAWWTAAGLTWACISTIRRTRWVNSLWKHLESLKEHFQVRITESPVHEKVLERSILGTFAPFLLHSKDSSHLCSTFLLLENT